MAVGQAIALKNRGQWQQQISKSTTLMRKPSCSCPIGKWICAWPGVTLDGHRGARAGRWQWDKWAVPVRLTEMFCGATWWGSRSSAKTVHPCHCHGDGYRSMLRLVQLVTKSWWRFQNGTGGYFLDKIGNYFFQFPTFSFFLLSLTLFFFFLKQKYINVYGGWKTGKCG